MADNEQRRALANTVPTTEVIRDAVTFPRDRLGEPLDISGDRFDAWLARVRRDAAREALDGLADSQDRTIPRLRERGFEASIPATESFARVARRYRDTHYPEQED